jgi:uncharacterized protein with PIN domain
MTDAEARCPLCRGSVLAGGDVLIDRFGAVHRLCLARVGLCPECGDVIWPGDEYVKDGQTNRHVKCLVTARPNIRARSAPLPSGP